MINNKVGNEILNFKDFLISLISCPIQKVAEDYYDQPNVIIYDNSDNEGLNFEIKSEKISDLIKKGYEITKDEIDDILEYFRRT